MISNFGAGMECLQNPSLISSFWKWGAVIFAVFATFSSIIKRIKLIFIHFHSNFNHPPSIQNKEILHQFSQDDDDISLASSDDDEEEPEEEDITPTTSFVGHEQRVDEDFRGKGCKNRWQTGHLKRRKSGGAWSEFTSGENIVNLRNSTSLGLSLDFDEDLINYESHNVVSLWGFDNDRKNIPATAMTSPALIFTAEGQWKSDGVVLSCYDTRMPRHTLALHAEWRLPAAAVAGGDGKVYFRDDVSGVVTVGDVRNVRVPLESVREFDGDTWWDADAVIVGDEFVKWSERRV
ncbi:hypothetical protein BUALT_Bualt05G0126000 [Buddleja alternifolia]|uniref:Uncharacterized protein n=1 Tax=Buddleja alternifolia TaxID=168488 RepID=A0AAV6XQE9_9LAMI|nr:hypothetical protein BUALT_Bualt05G0126000 [Buddleja alternifolia]